MRAITFRSLPRLFAASAMCSAACAGAFSLLGACAATETSSPLDAEDARVAAPELDAGTDADADTDTCTEDCEFFPATCAPDTFCLNGPFDPTSPTAGLDWRIRIRAIRGRSPSDVWIAGAAGTVAHFDGTSWTKSEVGTQETLGQLWLPNAGEITFRSLETVHSRGLGTGGADASVSPGGWSVRTLPPGAVGRAVTAVWPQPGAESLWIATTTDFWRLRLTGASQLEVDPRVPSSACGFITKPGVPCNQIRSLYGVPGERLSLWAVGSLGAAIRITDAEGAAPAAAELNTQTWNALNGVWASSNTDVWAVGGAGTIRHYTGDGIRWDVVPDVPTDKDLNAVWGTSSSDIWAVGDAGVVLHYDGTRWSRVKIAGLGIRRPDLHAVWSPEPGRVWIGGYGVVLALGGNP